MTWLGMAPAAEHLPAEFRQCGQQLRLRQQPGLVLGDDLVARSVLVDLERIGPLAPLWKPRVLAPDVDVTWLPEAVHNARRHHSPPSGHGFTLGLVTRIRATRSRSMISSAPSGQVTVTIRSPDLCLTCSGRSTVISWRSPTTMWNGWKGCAEAGP